MKLKILNKLDWQVFLLLSLIILSTLLYLLHYAIFHDAHQIFIYLLADIAFIPIEVLLVTFVIHRLLNIREKKTMLNKLNMVIGAFYSEVGISLLKIFSKDDQNVSKIRDQLIITNEWSDKIFFKIHKDFKKYESSINSRETDLYYLRSFLIGKRSFLLGLLENSNLLEHESFTDLLWAVFHLTEELSNREDVKNLSDADYHHLSNDIKRAYNLLILEWIQYIKHLKNQYPFLFSFALRTNPFDINASPQIN